jgi:hypothetical protein
MKEQRTESPAGNSGFAKVACQRTLADASQPPSQSRQTLAVTLNRHDQRQIEK